jgi:ribosome biogenesis GTPase
MLRLVSVFVATVGKVEGGDFLTHQAVPGVVLRAVGGFYRVCIDDREIHECKIAGRLKPRGAGGRREPVLPGDKVLLHEVDGVYVVKEVLPRVNQLVRPAIANIDLCVIVQAVTNPSPNLELIDRILVHTRHMKIATALCLTKTDLLDPDPQMIETYQQAGCRVLTTSAVNGAGISELATILKDKVSILSGPSGVGKSRLLNSVSPGFQRETGEVSRKLKRGRHTTRQVELLQLPQGGWVADSPGFSVLEFAQLTMRELPLLYPEFEDPALQCRFAGCMHRSEPGCVVREAVEMNQIDAGRYYRYLQFLKEVEENELNRY